MPIVKVALLAPAVLLACAAACLANPGRPRFVLLLAEGGALTALAIAVCAVGLLATDGPGAGPLLGHSGLGFSMRLDAVSVTMLLLVTFIGWVVVRYASTYLDGEDRQGAFTGWLCLTLAAVLLLVTAGTLAQLVAAWIATSLFLHRLLLFYPERAGAWRARSSSPHAWATSRCLPRR